MTKIVNKNIAKILEKGTPRQRMLLLANHIAETATNKPGFLSDSEFAALVESFKSPAEIRLYKKYKAVNSALQSLLPYLAQLRLSYRVEYTRIEGYSLLSRSYSNFEISFNAMLYNIKDKKQRTDLLNSFIKNSIVHFAIPQKTIKKFGDMESEFLTLSIVQPDNRTHTRARKITLSEIIEDHRKRAMKLLSSIKTLLKALKDYIDENDIQLTAYNDFIKEVENEITKDSPSTRRIHSSKEEQKTLFDHSDFQNLRFWMEYSNERNFYPKYDEAEIDQIEYNHYRSNYL